MTTASMGWYAARQLFPGVWCIESKGVMSYLVTGSERALLIDTGWGVGDLAGLVHSLSPLPLTVVITHGHVDHISGAYQFPEVWIDAADIPLAERAGGMRERILQRWQGETWPEGYSPESWRQAPAPTLCALPEDITYDLGDRVLQVIRTPGHTPGALCLLDADARLLFAGDTITRSVLMHLPDSLPMRRYAQSLQRLLEHRRQMGQILSGHSADPLPLSLLEDLEKAAQAIVDGKLTGTPEQTFFGEAHVARLGEAVINYLPDRI